METFKNGFTLIELMIVVAIIGILAAAAIPSITEAVCDAYGSTAESAITSVQDSYVKCLGDRNESSCSSMNVNSYNTYLPNDVIENTTIEVLKGSINQINYNGVGCQYNAAPGGITTNKLRWQAKTGNFVNY